MSCEVSFYQELTDQWDEAQLTAYNKAHASRLEGVDVVSISVLMEMGLLPHIHVPWVC